MTETIITGTIAAWLTSGSDVHEFESAIAQGCQQEVIKHLYFSPNDMTTCGWTQVGTAQVALQLDPHDERMASAIRTLEKQLATERAASMERQNAILDRISKLQALEYTVEA